MKKTIVIALAALIATSASAAEGIFRIRPLGVASCALSNVACLSSTVDLAVQAESSFPGIGVHYSFGYDGVNSTHLVALNPYLKFRSASAQISFGALGGQIFASGRVLGQTATGSAWATGGTASLDLYTSKSFFFSLGGEVVVIIGNNSTLALPGAQLGLGFVL